MRKSVRALTGRELKVYDSQEERDAALERRYSFDREGERSALAYISRHAPELVEAFFAWLRDGHATGDALADLPTWERERFGAELEPAAHGIMRFEVRRALGGPRPAVRPARPTTARPPLGLVRLVNGAAEAGGGAVAGTSHGSAPLCER